MTDLELRVTVDEANLILEALGGMPFKQVYALVGKIQEQASHQLGRSVEDAEPGTEEPSEDEHA